MKRLALLVLFFYACTFAQPPQVKANAAIGLLLPGVIGATIIGIAGTQYAMKNPHPGYSYDGAEAIKTGIWAYQKIHSAGTDYILGKAATAVLDIENAYNRGIMQAGSALAQIIRDKFGDPNASPGVGSVVATNIAEGVCNISGARKIISIDPQIYTMTLTDWNTAAGAACAGADVNAWANNANPHLLQIRLNNVTCNINQTCVSYRTATTSTTTDAVNWPAAGPPPIISPPDVKDLAQRIGAGATPGSAVEAELDGLMKEHPELWTYPDAVATPQNPADISDYPPAQPITNADVNQWAQGQSQAAKQEYIDNLEDLVAANPDNAELKAELERAKAEQAQQEAEDVADTFDPISASPFGEAYAPDEFDISARFTTFLNNVKSSSLFSFSSSFFNSLPGGGSPVYEIEAGQYGHHTIDLSQAMTAGLAVLKTVLMLCFGFLSIRAVIMKR